jgi:hypothetical protein
MADRPKGNLGVIRALIERAPDKAVRDLATALGGDMAGGALGEVRAMVEAEVADRRVRDIVLAPIRPMFGSRPDGIGQLAFPPSALTAVWQALKALQPRETALAAVTALRRPEEGVVPPVYDDLCRSAGAALRERANVRFAALADSLAGLDQQLAGCLDLVPVARPALARMPEWLRHMSDDRAAAVRLAFKDAVAVAPDGGQRLFEVFFANMAEPWMILRLIAAVMHRPVDNYVSNSELAVFGERLIADIEARLNLVRVFDLDGGAAAGMAAATHVRLFTAEIDEFERALHLGKEGPWGAKLSRAKSELAKVVEGWLKKAGDVLAKALPNAPVRIGGQIIRHAPKLDAPPSALAMNRAKAMLVFVEQIRGPATAGGYNVLRLKVVEELEQHLSSYVEDLLDSLHNGDGGEMIIARVYLEDAAELMARLRDDTAAQIIRRRAAAA